MWFYLILSLLYLIQDERDKAWYEVNIHGCMFMMKYDTCMIWKCSLLYFGASESDIQIKLLTVWICATLQNMIQESDVRISGGFRGTNRVQSASISYMEDIQIKYSCPETGLPATCIRFCNVAQIHTVTIFIWISNLYDISWMRPVLWWCPWICGYPATWLIWKMRQPFHKIRIKGRILVRNQIC